MTLKKPKYIDFLKTVKSIFASSWRFFFFFVLIYTILGQIVILTFIKDLIDFSIYKAGYEFLNPDVLSKWILSPLTIPILIVSMAIFGFYIMFEMSTLILYIDYIRKGERVSWRTCLAQSLKRSSRVLIPRNWGFILAILLIFPFTLLSFNFSIIFQLNIPEFIIDFIVSNVALSIFYFIVIIILNISAFILILSIPPFIIKLKSFRESVKTTIGLIRRNFKYVILSYIAGMIAVLCIAIFILFISIALLTLIVKFYSNPSNMAENLNEYYLIFSIYGSFIVSICIVIFNFIFITYIYIAGTDQPFVKIPRKRMSFKSVTLTTLCFLIVLPITGIYLDYAYVIPMGPRNISGVNEIVAHRAGAIYGPENTLVSLEESIKNGVPYAEIDVQQSKDGKLVISHDTNLKRTTGVSKNVYDLNYDEIEKLDAGSYFSPKYANTKIPTLAQMMDMANNKIKLMIEIKENGHDNNIVSQVIDEIKAHNFENQCSIASMNLNVLKEVKDIDPKITTVYITPMIYGNYYSIKYVDAFSIEATFVSRENVLLAHMNHKKIYVWTVNNEKGLNKVLNLNVDGIVTDNPSLADSLRNKNANNNFFTNLFNNLF